MTSINFSFVNIGAVYNVHILTQSYEVPGSEQSIQLGNIVEQKVMLRCCDRLVTVYYFDSVHAAVIAINDAIDHGDPTGTLAAMRNPNAMLLNLDQSAAQHYQDTLFQAKAEKVANSRKRVSEADL